MSRMNEKVAAMKQPEERARDYLALSQFTIILSVVCAFFPYNFLCLIAVFMLSKMVCALCCYVAVTVHIFMQVVNHNDEKDYMSARTSSWITLACNLFALIFGGLVTLTIFLTAFSFVIIELSK